MPLYRDEGVVLRTQRLGEADRIVTLLTREHGRVRAVAKGVRRTRSKFGARLEPFGHVQLQLATGRSLDIVTQAQTIPTATPLHEAVAADYDRYTAGSAMLETAERLTAEEREPAIAQYVLLVAALRSMAGAAREPRLVLDSYLLRAMGVAGYAPSFGDCARCGTPGPHRAFSLPGGGMMCPDCRPPGSAAPAPATVELLGALLTGDWPVVDASAGANRRQASGLVAAFTAWHLERGLRSLAHVDARPAQPQVGVEPRRKVDASECCVGGRVVRQRSIRSSGQH